MSTLNTIGLRGRNRLINGDMTFAQRGTSFAAIASGTYSLDRYKYYKAGTMVHTITQDSDVPTLDESGFKSNSSLRLNLTTADTGIGSTDYCWFEQMIEGYNIIDLLNKKATLSFWVKATLAGTYCIALRPSGNNYNYLMEYTITANTWQKVVLPIDFTGCTNGGTWNYTNGIGLQVLFVLAMGSSFFGSAGVWGGTSISTSNQFNGVNTGATDFRISQVQLKEGEYSDPKFERAGIDIGNELMLCQRYYEIISSSMSAFSGGWITTTDFRCWWPFKVMKRISGGNFSYAGVLSTDIQIFGTTRIAPTAIVINSSGYEGTALKLTTATGTANANGIVMFYSASPAFMYDAEL